MVVAPDHPVCRLPDDNSVAGKDQHKLAGNVKLDIESHMSTTRQSRVSAPIWIFAVRLTTRRKKMRCSPGFIGESIKPLPMPLRWLQQMKEARLGGPSLPVITGAQTETGGFLCNVDSLSKACANRRADRNALRTSTATAGGGPIFLGYAGDCERPGGVAPMITATEAPLAPPGHLADCTGSVY